MAKTPYEELTPRQRLFCENYHENSNATQSAIKAGYGEAGAGSEGSRLLKNPKIKDYLDELAKERRERVQSRLSAMSEKAAEAIYNLAMTAESENVRATLLKDLMDRGGFKPTDRVEQKSDVNAKIEFGFQDPTEE